MEPLASFHAKIQSGGPGWCQAMAARSSLVDKGLIAIDEYASDDGGGMPVEEEEGHLGPAYAKDVAWMTFLKWNMKALCMSS